MDLYLYFWRDCGSRICAGSRFRISAHKTQSHVKAALASDNLVSSLLFAFIKTTLGDLAVSQYYAVSLFSKIINMLVQPLATLILSYLADRKTSGFNLRLFQKTTVCCLGMCVVLTAGCCIGTPIAVRILYPNLMDVVPALNLPVNIGSVLGFAGQLMLVFLLAEASLNNPVWLDGICVRSYRLKWILFCFCCCLRHTFFQKKRAFAFVGGKKATGAGKG